MTKKDFAEALGVTPRSLRDWEKKPTFPSIKKYDEESLAVVKEWQEAEERKGSEANDLDRELSRTIKEHRIRMLRSQAEKAERLEAIARGNVLPRDEFISYCSEAITLTRDRLRDIPKRIAKSVPKKYQARLITEGKRELTLILDEFARMLERGPADETK